MLKLDRKLAEGSSIKIAEILEEIDRAAGSDARLLISGNVTIRKEVIARRIHEQSARSLEPFVSMTCAGVRSELFGSLFFGCLERANRGTLFIDEVNELDSRLQEGLLTFVETGIARWGDRSQLTTDVRLISGCDRDLHQEVMAGRFNAALFYRLNIIHIVVPDRYRHDQDISRRSGDHSTGFDEVSTP